MMFEFCATLVYGISKEIALFNLFCSISGKFKYDKKIGNVNFEETNIAVSILVLCPNKRLVCLPLYKVSYKKVLSRYALKKVSLTHG